MSEPVNTFEAQQQGRPTGPLVQGYEVIIGFETHAQLSTASKIFSRAATASAVERMSGSVTISRSGVPARFRSMPDLPTKF